MSLKPNDLLDDDVVVPDEVIARPTKLTVETIAGLQVTSPASEGYVNMLIYGEPGVGKTRFTGSAVLVPEWSPVLLVDFEGGTLSLADDYKDVDVVRLKSWQAVDRLYGTLYDKNPYKTVILDSLSETQKFSMSEIMKDVVRKAPDRDPDIASVREWGKNGEQMRRLVRALRDLPCNTFFTALAREERDESTGITKTRPGLPGQLKGEVAGYVDIVGYMYKKEIRAGTEREMKTLLLTQGTERQLAKDRSGKLPAIIENPTMREVYRLIQGDKG